MTDRASGRTTVLLVRHGECRGNSEGLFRGRTDFPLNETGLRQAGEVASEVAGLRPDVVLTSPLTRAVQTAEAIARECGVGVKVEEGFINIGLGGWEGRLKKDIAKDHPEEWRLWLESPELLRLEGAESMDAVQKRSLEALDRIMSKHRGKTVVAVSHRTVIMPLLAGCLGIRPPYFWRLHMDTAAYSVLNHSEVRGYTLYSLNRTGHLSGFSTEWE
ncbi:MAG: histidine phosphatase family protein [Synergistaceae bacterium]|nr:histidine phosphatase family protein [Synergistota bacterium]NLM72300.1 histidine phosphatase family protein [Synergistaceae bacterium]